MPKIEVDEAYYKGLENLKRAVGRVELAHPGGQQLVKDAYRSIPEPPPEPLVIEGWISEVANRGPNDYYVIWQLPVSLELKWNTPHLYGPVKPDRDQAVRAANEMLKDLVANARVLL